MTYSASKSKFPFLFGGAFIEAFARASSSWARVSDFPSFSEGLSLRLPGGACADRSLRDFPSFSEGLSLRQVRRRGPRRVEVEFPFLFGGAFIEAMSTKTKYNDAQ